MQLSGKIKVGARPSPLSLAQVAEIEKELPDAHFEIVPIQTIGDRDLKTSLRILDKTDFFTRDIDDALLEGKCRIAIHSAKDLPYPLRKGLKIIALTNGVDSSDSLVLKDGIMLGSLSKGARIGTSSIRREEIVSQLKPGLEFIDIRGTIHQRLALLENGQLDGVVIAEAALIRLGLTHLNRIKLPGDTAPLQGKLAVVSKENDDEMEALFSSLDTREVHLHTGLTPPSENYSFKQIHCSLIETIPLHLPEHNFIKNEFPKFTHLIFTSKTTVNYCIDLIKNASLLRDKHIISVGEETGSLLKSFGCNPMIASEHTSEGICSLLDTLSLENSYLLWMHSALSRSVIKTYLERRGVRWKDSVLYITIPKRPSHLILLETINRIFFNSPSAIDAFIAFYGSFPSHIHYECIGPVTEKHFKKVYQTL